MTNYWPVNLFISLFFPIVVGYLTLMLLLRKKAINPLLSFAVSYGLGLGILSQWMLMLGMIELPLGLKTIIIPLSIFLGLFWLIGKKAGNPVVSDHERLFSPKKIPISRYVMRDRAVSSALIAYISFILLLIFWRSLTMPIQSWDALSTSAFKAKIFFYDRSLHHLNLPKASYPLFVPLIEAWVSLNLNVWDDLMIKFIFPVALLSYAMIHYSFLRSLTNRNWALGGVCLLFSAPFIFYHSTIAYREIFQMYYNCTTILLILLWHKEKNDRILLLASLFAGLTTWVKLEGTGYLFVHILTVLYILSFTKGLTLQNKLIKFFKFIVPACLFFLPFYVYKISLNISAMENRMNLATTWEHWARIPQIVHDFTWSLFFSGNWNFLWFLLFVSFLGSGRKFQKSGEIKLLTFALGMSVVIYLVVLTFTSAAIDNKTTLSRVLLHFFPLSTLLIILLNCPDPSSPPEPPAP